MKANFLLRLDRYGPALTAIFIAIASCAYLVQAYLTSSRLYNIIFLVPMVLTVVLLAVVVCIRVALNAKEPIENPEAQAPSDEPESTSETSNLAIAGLMLGLVIYAFAIPYLGFDVASAAFMALSLWLLGERRLIVIAIFSIVTAFVVTWLLVNGANVPAVTFFV